jgi:hypothetical protein
MEVNGLLDIPTLNLVYIYKITSVHTGHYYIGQSSSVKDAKGRELQSFYKGHYI